MPRCEAVRRSGGVASAYLTSAVDADEWSASRIGRFTSRERERGTRGTEGWVGSWAVVNVVQSRKISCFCWRLHPGLPARSYALIYIHTYIHTQTNNKLHGFSPQANYTDRATDACRRSYCYRLCGLVVRVPGCRSRDPSSISSAARFSEKLWVWNGDHSA
jgi:hypothetical protein